MKTDKNLEDIKMKTNKQDIRDQILTIIRTGVRESEELTKLWRQHDKIVIKERIESFTEKLKELKLELKALK